MMHSGKKLRVSVLAAAICLLFSAAAFAQQIRFPDFTSIANLQLNGVAMQATYQSKSVLRLTKGNDPNNNVFHPEASSVFFNLKQPISMGFTTYFSFTMHNPTTTVGPGDGFSFLIQNSSSTDSTMGASGAGLTALGAGSVLAGAGGLGYAGISNSLAVEFDVNQDAWDPNSNHVAVQSCGTNFNTPVHIPGLFTIGQNTHVSSCLVSPSAITSNINMLADGTLHQVVIEYDPPSSKYPNGALMVWVDPQLIKGTHTAKSTSPPVINIPFTIAGLNLDGGSAWVGFTASQSQKETVQDINEWEFTPHQATSVQQPIPNGGIPNTFTFGGHDAVVTYPVGTNGNGLYMTVLATPTDPTTFQQTRLVNTQFSNESCVTYLETGGNCVVYSVTCQLSDKVTQTPCPSELEDTIALSTSYYTANGVTPTNADFLKADPIGSNNWISICNPPNSMPPCYDPNTFDGTTSGKGHDLSDLVATYLPGHPVAAAHQQSVAEPRTQVFIKPKEAGK